MRKIGLEPSENTNLDARFENSKKGHQSASRERRTFEYEQVYQPSSSSGGQDTERLQAKGGKGNKGKYKEGKGGKNKKGKGKQ